MIKIQQTAMLMAIVALPSIGLSLSALAQGPLAYEHLNQPKSSVNHQLSKHHRPHHPIRPHYRGYREPWRWGAGWNNYWGPSFGIGWSSGYRWGNDWRYPYRYNRYQNDAYSYQPVRAEPVSKAPPEQTTTSVQYDSGLKTLPDNARVIQQDGKVLYQWQGQIYAYDWNLKTYVKQ